MSKYMSSFRLFSKILGLIGVVSLASCSSIQGFYSADGIYSNQPMKIEQYPVNYETYFDEMKQEADSYAYIVDSEDYFSQSEANQYGGWGEQTGDTNIYLYNNWDWGFGYGFSYGWGYPYFGWGWDYPYYWHNPYYYWGWNYPRYAYRNVSRSSFHRPSRTVYSAATNSLRQSRRLNLRTLSSSRALQSRNNLKSRNQTVRRPVSRNTISRSNHINRTSRSSQNIQRNSNRSFSPSRSFGTGSSRSMSSGMSRGSSRSR